MNKIKITLSIISTGAIILATSCNSVNPDTETTVTAESSSSLQAKDFLSAYSTNQKEADDKYMNETVSVSGKVANAVATGTGFNIEIEGENSLETVSCAFDSKTLDADALPEEGSSITVKGKVTGYTEEDMMGLKTINMVQCLIE